MQSHKTLYTFVVILLVTAFVGIYGHAIVDDHGAEEVCQICAFLQSGASVGVTFTLTVFLVSQVLRIVVVPRSGILLPVGSPGRSPPVV